MGVLKRHSNNEVELTFIGLWVPGDLIKSVPPINAQHTDHGPAKPYTGTG